MATLDRSHCVATAIPVAEEVCSSQTEQGMFVVGTVHANLRCVNTGACLTLYLRYINAYFV